MVLASCSSCSKRHGNKLAPSLIPGESSAFLLGKTDVEIKTTGWDDHGMELSVSASREEAGYIVVEATLVDNQTGEEADLSGVVNMRSDDYCHSRFLLNLDGDIEPGRFRLKLWVDGYERVFNLAPEKPPDDR